MHYAYIPAHYLPIYRHYNNNFIMIFSAYSGNMQSLQYSVDIMPSICRKQRKILTHYIGVGHGWTVGNIIGTKRDLAVHSAKETAAHLLYHQRKVK